MPEDQSPSVRESRTLLVVDDDAAFRTRVVRAFRERGFDAVGAMSYEEAVVSARLESPELALVDLRLSGKSGLELVRDLKILDPKTNIVVLTGYGSIATAVQSLQLGATSYLTKPVDADQILAAFEQVDGSIGVALASPVAPTAGACRVGAYPAGAGGLRRQRVAGRQAAGASPAFAAAQALEVPGEGERLKVQRERAPRILRRV